MPDSLSTATKYCTSVACSRNEKLEKYYMDRIRTRVVSGVRTGVHASEVDGSCLYKTVLRRTLDKPPPVDDDAVLKFMRGWAFETYIAPGLQLPVTKDGVTCSIDDMNEHGLIEIKSTAKSLGTFNPSQTYYWWVHRMMIYAYAHGKTEFSLVAFFSRGNYKDIQEALRAWTYKWSQLHLNKFWKEYVLPRRDLLQTAFKGWGEYREDDFKKPLIFSSSKNECSWCEMKKWEHCDGVKS